MAPDGAVLAMVGGRDYAQSQFNRAVQARRQPGSLFKLFVYLAALRAGMSPDGPVEDAPLQIADWQPQNYADRYLGVTDLRTAFAQSLNTAAVRLQEQVGRAQVIALAKEMGIGSPMPPHPSLALGSAEAQPARAHRRLCRRARRCPPGRALCSARRAGAGRRDLPATPGGIPATGLAETGDHGSPVRGGALRHRQCRRP